MAQEAIAAQSHRLGNHARPTPTNGTNGTGPDAGFTRRPYLFSPTTLAPIPIPMTTDEATASADRKSYFHPGVDFGGNPNNPSAWHPKPTQSFVYTPGGGRRDMSQAHPFVMMHVEWDGDRIAVDLELTDGVKNIECQGGRWRIKTKDKAHYDVAKQWPKEKLILVTSTFCGGGAQRKLLMVSDLKYEEPDIITAYGEGVYLALAPPVRKFNVNLDNHNPNLARRDMKDDTVFYPKKHDKRFGFEDLNPVNIATSVVAPAVTSIATQAESVATGVADTVTSGAESVGTQVATGAESVGTQIATAVTSAAESVGTVVVDGATSVYSVASSHVSGAVETIQSAIQSGFSWSKSITIDEPKSTPTAKSPWGTPGTKYNLGMGIMDVWDLGMHISGGLIFTGGFAMDIANIGHEGFFNGHIGINGSDWKLNFPLGFDFHGTSANPIPIQQQLFQPIPLCEGFCYSVKDVFDLGPNIQAALHMELAVKSKGRISTGFNVSYDKPWAYWDVTSAKNSKADGWHGDFKKWFDVDGGKLDITGSIGLDIIQANGFDFKRLKAATTNISVTDRVSLVVNLKDNVEHFHVGDEKKRRDLRKRYQTRDESLVPAALRRRDTCDGVSIKLSLDEIVMLQAGVADLGTMIPFTSTRIPLPSYCISDKHHSTKTHGAHNATMTDPSRNGTHPRNGADSGGTTKDRTSLGDTTATASKDPKATDSDDDSSGRRHGKSPLLARGVGNGWPWHPNL
ncbi:MAG: hypothetical protein M1820_007437 [Bogoriella megaspora]|nr:MAG: hypothetical protein M1820_007437 [Bogoriella megaspora]